MTTINYPSRLAALVERFRGIDRAMRIELLISMAGKYHGIPETVAQRPYPETHRVPDCESEAYVWAREQPDGTLKYYFAVENPQGISAKATAVILGRTLSGAPLEQVAGLPADVIYQIFGYELSMGKNLGLTGMLAMAQGEAKRRLKRNEN